MHTMHLLPGVAIQPNLELKTCAKQLLGSLPLVIALLVIKLLIIIGDFPGNKLEHLSLGHFKNCLRPN
jgi:hypothetical protein